MPILSGILLASFVLLPVINTINSDLNIRDIIDINYNISIIVIMSIIFGLFYNKKDRFLSIIVGLLIVFCSKYYLCYIVLLSIVVNNFIDGVLKDKIDYRLLVVGILISLIYLLDNSCNLITIITFLLMYFLYKDKKNKEVIFVLVTLIIFGSTLYKCFDMDLYNKYFEFNNYSYNNNVLYNMLVGNNTSEEEMIGYNKIMDKEGNIYYKNNDVLYKGFATNNIISYEDYEKLNGFAKQEVLLTNIVVDNRSKNEYVSYVKEVEIDKDNYDIDVKDINKYEIKLDKKHFNKIIYIEFEATSNNCGNSSIKINNVINTITCDNKNYSYVISDKNLEEINVIINKGNYKIRNIKVYSLDYARIENSKMDLDQFIVEKWNNNT